MSDTQDPNKCIFFFYADDKHIHSEETRPMQPQPLSASQLQQFSRDGFLLIRNVLDAAECARFDREVLQPALRACGGINEEDPSTWSNHKLNSMATGDYDETSKGPIPGAMIWKGTEDGKGDPIPDELCLDMSPMNPILNQLHGDSTCWKWQHSNLGWIHVRFPVHDEPEKRWHVDGGHFDPHYLHSPEQSVVVLPMVRSVAKGGGNTSVLAKSHRYMSHLLYASGKDGVSKKITQDCRELGKVWPIDQIVEVEPCQAGDVLLLHPFVVHAAGFTRPGHPLRISFNMGTQWTRPVMVCEASSWLEDSIWDALQEEPMQVTAPYPFGMLSET
jgi:hypothetical protein